MITASVLGKIRKMQESQFTSEQYTVKCTTERWRKFVVQRLSRTYQIIGRRAIQRAIALLVEAWSRMDFEPMTEDQVKIQGLGGGGYPLSPLDR
ncbi:hypothetical protein CORC01_03763 [Colletotrichum orchidophilum]|uniref:Uncharacterized protein n=1 Tax=Colletotrichum orchidophilum TaxID=1209926 RepID=A0A1G4BHT7_9PEZI|nr:uncharacterized protein CORC01_03763 [Colletotrichum orchidophilum]OHF00935.1 hypothetical protein CORC01_03763 [Colletotrichum orchidophilum]